MLGSGDLQKGKKAMNNQGSVQQYQKGKDLMSRGDFSGAVAALSVALDLDPSNVDARAERGHAHFMAGEISRAIDDFSTVLKDRPDDLEVLVGRATAYMNQAFQDANLDRMMEMMSARAAVRRDVDRALAIAPRDSMALKLKAWLSEG
jgi:tetratricopeptide (TPR) repeat protein